MKEEGSFSLETTMGRYLCACNCIVTLSILVYYINRRHQNHHRRL